VTETPQEQNLFAQLGSEKRSVLVSAIVQLAKVSSSPQALFRLRKLAESGDREVTFFAAQAIVKIQARLGQLPEATSAPTSLDRTALLAPLKEEVPRILAVIRQTPEQIPEDLEPVVAVFLGKHGNETDAPWLASHIEKLDSNLALPFMEALETVSPKALLPLLAALLGSVQPLVRCRAISSLRRIDPDEAEAHLSELLASRRPEDRLAGLSIAFLFPFPKVRELIFAILQEDCDPEVIKGCGTILVSNPEKENALRLLGLIDTADKAQAGRLSEIFRDLCRILGAAGIVPEAEARPEAMIPLWRKDRLKRFLTDLEVQIAVTTGPRRESMEAWLGKNIQLPEVRALLERLSLNPATDEMARNLLQKWAKDQQLAALASGPGQYSDEDKCQFLRKLDPQQYKTWIEWARQQAREASPTVRAAALNVLHRLDSSADDCTTIAEAGIGSGEPAVQVAAARLIEKFDPKRLIPLLPTLLGSQDGRLRARGIRIALQHDEKAALQALESMLGAPEPAIRANAVSCLFLFPVEKVTALLLKTLQKEDHSAIARQILVVLLSNPSMELLDKLDHLHSRSNPSVAMTVAQARMDLFDIILKLGLDGEAKLPVKPPPGPKAFILRGLGQSSTTPSPSGAGSEPETHEGKPFPAQKSDDKPYSVPQVRSAMRSRLSAEQQKASSETKSSGATFGNLNAWVLVAVVTASLAFMPTLFLQLVGTGGSVDSRPKAEAFDPRKEDQETIHHTEVPAGLRMNRMSRVTGKVKEVRPDGTLLFVFQEKTFMLERVATVPLLVGNEDVDVEMLPYQILKDGTIVAECGDLHVKKMMNDE